ncbi:hypothetical protein ACTHPT_14105 [Bacillus altitudinis]|uniref:hypothetical protein n=1 Tax=Bacillus altitudinis TaxID=293387 RepID=UPI003F7BF5B8
MHKIYKYDLESFVLIDNDVISDDSPLPSDGWTDVSVEKGLYIPKFNPDLNKWTESATQDYIDSLKNNTDSSSIDTLIKQNAILSYHFAKLQSEFISFKKGIAE